MDSYLLVLGYWNLIGSFLMFGLIRPTNGQKALVDWSFIFREKFTLGFYGKLFLCWAAGLNIFFALINIMSVSWDVLEIKTFLIYFDVFSYIFFLMISIWAWQSGKCGKGIFVVFVIFLVFIIWGILALGLF